MTIRILHLRLTSTAPVGPVSPIAATMDLDSDLTGGAHLETSLSVYGFDELDRIEDLVNIAPDLNAPGRVDKIAASQQRLLRIGAALFDQTLGRWGQWTSLLQEVRDRGDRVRIAVRSPHPSIAAQPWELLYDTNSHAFLGLMDDVSILRNPDRVGRPRKVSADRPLRILLCGSTPRDLPPIDVEPELLGVLEATRTLEGAEAHRLSKTTQVCTFSQFTEAIRDGNGWDIVHFSGHGGFDARVGGFLAFTTSDGRADAIPASQIATLLSSQQTIRLVVMNACRGAMGDGRQAVDSVATALTQAGVPACVSMQFEVTDAAALPFAASLYSEIISRGDIEMATLRSRQAINRVSLVPDDVVGSALRSAEWATPVLHLDPEDARIFKPDEPEPADSTGRPLANSPTLIESPRMNWTLTFHVDGTSAETIRSVERAVRTVAEVRKWIPTDSGFVALAGTAPFAMFATEEITAEVSADGPPSRVSIRCRPNPKNRVVFDQGRNSDFITRLALALNISIESDAQRDGPGKSQ